jgi:2-(1,2-epoxy-1,2-dihydrophenyl)acetyl-CoA isomerase
MPTPALLTIVGEMSSGDETMPEGTVRYRVDSGVATVTLDRPDSLNSMNTELMDDISAAFARVASDDGVRVAILTGEGRGFCSGADLRGASSDAHDEDDPVDVGEATAAGMDDHFHPAIRAITSCPVPTIARVNGVAAGGGFGLALTCDVTIAARSAFFVATFGPRLGIVPDLGTTWSLPTRAGRARALGLTMLGERITAEQAEEWGLIWKAVDDERLDDEVGAVAELLGRSSPAAMVRIRDAVTTASTRTFSEQLDVERDHQRVLIPRNMAEGADAFLEKREPRFDGDRY